jgi:hypoxia up-regulated 1
LDVFQNLHQHLDKALEKAGISKSELNSVELIGGASRIPLVSKIVKEHFDGIEVGSHINGDEAMAFGASLRAANLSITFRVKQLHFYDGFEKDIRCVVSSGDKTLQDKILFTKDSQHGENAILQLSPPESDIKVDLFYGEELVKSYVSQNITAWRDVYNESTYNFSSDPNLVLGFVISTTNIVDLKESYVNLTFNQTDFKTVDDWIEEDVKTEEQNN